jgi:hypothetical protein
MMNLISLGITVGFGTSLAGTFGLLEIEVWWELATLTTIMILGHLVGIASGFPGPWRAQRARRLTARYG